MDGLNPEMVEVTFLIHSRSQLCWRLHRPLQWEYYIGNQSYLKLAFRKEKKKKELAIPAISQEFLGPLGWTAEPCGDQLSKHTWCETLTKHEQETKSMGRSMGKAHIAVIHMSLTFTPNLSTSKMITAQEKGEWCRKNQDPAMQNPRKICGEYLLLTELQNLLPQAEKWELS